MEIAPKVMLGEDDETKTGGLLRWKALTFLS